MAGERRAIPNPADEAGVPDSARAAGPVRDEDLPGDGGIGIAKRSAESRISGGCLCGAIRYEIDAGEGIADVCHCRDCRRASGGIAVAWLQVRPERFRLVAGVPASYLSSARGRRHFCPRCGAQIAMTDPDGRSTGITIATLDDPEAVQPMAHGWDRQRPSWLVLDDGLPRFAEDPPYDRAPGPADDEAVKTALDSNGPPA